MKFKGGPVGVAFFFAPQRSLLCTLYIVLCALHLLHLLPRALVAEPVTSEEKCQMSYY